MLDEHTAPHLKPPHHDLKHTKGEAMLSPSPCSKDQTGNALGRLTEAS